MDMQAYQQMELDEFTTAIVRLPDTELLTLKNYLEEAVGSIKAQMHEARARGRIDAEWQARAARARGHLSRRVQAIQNELRRRKLGRAAQLEQAFVSLARLHLPAEVFEQLMAEARELSQ